MFHRLMPAWIIAGLLALLVFTSLVRRNHVRKTMPNESPMTYRQPFYEQWIRKHEAYPYECWSDSGYDSSKSHFSRDIQLLAAMDYGKSDIDNGGFHQFFYNSTGVFAPEMLEWSQKNGLHDVARVMQDAMLFLGDDYPRDRNIRIARLPDFQPRDGRDWDPFDRLNEEFYAALSNNGTRYEDAANNWLKTTCKISALNDMEIGRTKR